MHLLNLRFRFPLQTSTQSKTQADIVLSPGDRGRGSCFSALCALLGAHSAQIAPRDDRSHNYAKAWPKSPQKQDK